MSKLTAQRPDKINFKEKPSQVLHTTPFHLHLLEVFLHRKTNLVILSTQAIITLDFASFKMLTVTVIMFHFNILLIHVKNSDNRLVTLLATMK